MACLDSFRMQIGLIHGLFMDIFISIVSVLVGFARS